MLYHQCMCFSHLMLDSITSVYNVRRSSTIRLVSSGTKKKTTTKPNISKNINRNTLQQVRNYMALKKQALMVPNLDEQF